MVFIIKNNKVIKLQYFVSFCASSIYNYSEKPFWAIFVKSNCMKPYIVHSNLTHHPVRVTTKDWKRESSEKNLSTFEFEHEFVLGNKYLTNFIGN